MSNDVNEVTEVVPEDEGNSNNTNNSSVVTKSAAIAASVPTRTKDDSGYSSFISQGNNFIRTSSPIVTQNNNNSKTDSPGTSYSSRNSALANDEEMAEMFLNSGNFLPIEKGSEKMKDFMRELDYSPEFMHVRHSLRSSPWTNRPDSVNEEEEDSDKEAHYSCSLPQESKLTTGLRKSVSRLVHRSENRRYSLDIESERRREIIASKLLEIADNLKTNQVRSRINSTSSDNGRLSSRRHSHSSFADIVPCGCGSAVDLILSLYDVYKQHSMATRSSVVVTSKSMANMAPKSPKTNSRNRSYTE